METQASNSIAEAVPAGPVMSHKQRRLQKQGRTQVVVSSQANDEFRERLREQRKLMRLQKANRGRTRLREIARKEKRGA